MEEAYVTRVETMQFALRAAADEIQAKHPGETKNSVVFLRAKADGLGNMDGVFLG